MNNNTKIELEDELKELEKELTNNWILCSTQDMKQWGKLEKHIPEPLKQAKMRRFKG